MMQQTDDTRPTGSTHDQIPPPTTDHAVALLLTAISVRIIPNPSTTGEASTASLCGIRTIKYHSK